MRARVTVWAAAILFLLAIGLKDAHAQGACLPAGQQWVMTCDGSLAPDGKTLTPAKALAVASVDYTGAFTSNGTLNLGGQLGAETAKGTMFVDTNCTGNLAIQRTVNGVAAPSMNFLVLVTYGQNAQSTVDLLSVDANSVFSCKLTRVMAMGVAPSAPIIPPTPAVITGVPSHPIYLPPTVTPH